MVLVMIHLAVKMHGFIIRLIRIGSHRVAHCLLKLLILIATSYSLVFVLLHFDEHAIQFFHFLYALLILISVLLLYFLRWLVLGGLFNQGLGVLAVLLDGVDCTWVDIVEQRWGIKLLHPVLEFFPLSKFEEVLKSHPLFIVSFDGHMLFFCVLRCLDHLLIGNGASWMLA